MADNYDAILRTSSNVDVVQECLQDFIASNNTGNILDKIKTYIELYQSSDYVIMSACNSVDEEISLLQREIEAHEDAQRAVEDARRAISGI